VAGQWVAAVQILSRNMRNTASCWL